MTCIHCSWCATYSFGPFCDKYGHDVTATTEIGGCPYFDPDGDICRKYKNVPRDEIRNIDEEAIFNK